MPKRARVLEPIARSKVLVVEGDDEKPFFEALLGHLGIDDVQIVNAHGKDNVRPAILALPKTEGFAQVTSVGVVRDAEPDANSVLHSIVGALNAAGLPAPPQPLYQLEGPPKVIFLIVPHGRDRGALEDPCLQSVAEDPAWKCVGAFFDCVSNQLGSLPSHLPKAQVRAFLATRPDPTKRLGKAAKAGYWPWSHSVFDPLKHFVRSL